MWRYCALLLSFFLSACSQERSSMNIYVVVPANSFDAFADEVLVVASSEGMTSSIGQAVDDEGNTVNVIEARSTFLKIWIVNLPISGHEHPSCEILPQPGHDDSWYIVSVRFRLPVVGLSASPVFGVRTAERIQEELRQRLLFAGYQVDDEAPSCALVSDNDLLRERD